MPFPPPLQRRLEDSMVAHGVAGASAALRDGAGTELQAAAGADLLSGEKVSPDDIRPYWSFTKTFVAATILRIAASGRMQLDAPVDRYFKEVDLPREVTLRRLLNHTAGIADYGTLRGYIDSLRNHPDQPWSSENYFAVARLPPSYPPGAGWSYSNTGYFLLRMILHRAEGGVEAALHQEALAPLGLRAVFVVKTSEDLARLAPGTSRHWGREVDSRRVYHPDWVGTGLLAGTAIDGARFLDRLLRGELLKRDWLDQMQESVATPPAPGWRSPRYGLGLMLDLEHPIGAVVGHGGAGPGYGAAAFRVTSRQRKRNVTVVVLTNTDGDGAAEQMALDLAEAHLSR